MLELHRYSMQQKLGPKSLKQIMDGGLRLLASTPTESHPKVTRLLRLAIERCEAEKPPALPSGETGLAILALETVANAIACWQRNVTGRPLFAHKGRAFYSTGSALRRTAKYLGSLERKVQILPTLLIFLEGGIALRAPRWFMGARDLKFPVERETLEKCKRIAGLALRDYLTSLVGENLLGWPNGKPVGGGDIVARLSLSGSEERRATGDLRAESPNGLVEEVHKTADSTLRKIAGFIPGRLLPFGIWLGPKDI